MKDGFDLAAAPLFCAPEQRRTALRDGVGLIVQRSADAPAFMVYGDSGAGDVAYAKVETIAPVRLLFRLDRVVLANLSTLSMDGELNGDMTLDWVMLALVAPGSDTMVHLRPRAVPRIGPTGRRRSFGLDLALARGAFGNNEVLAVLQLGRGAGRLRFRRDPAGREGVLPDYVAPLKPDLRPDLAITGTAAERHAELARLQARYDSLSDELDANAAAIDSLRSSLGLPARIAVRVASPRKVAAPVQIGARATGSKALLNWVIGGPENADWAYGNNARRLAARMPQQRHVIAGTEPADLALYFDPIVAERHPVEARRTLQRIGGPRPINRLYGDDPEALAEGLSSHAAVIPLNVSLHRRCRGVPGRLRFIPNAIDLDEWHPERRGEVLERPFTIGFAASLTSSAEAEVKGWAIAQKAAQLAGVELLATQRAANSAPLAPDRMLPDFYAKIDAVLHPVAPGREGTSNVLMEALALGLPVVCTPDAGLHGELLVNDRTGLIRDRNPEAFAHAILLLRHDRKMRERLGAAGRAFAERHHDIRIAARRYELLLDEVLHPIERARRRVSILPFWQPAESFGSSRLRGLYVARALAAAGAVDVGLDHDPAADAVIVIQMADDPLMETLRASDQFVIYDVCDRYFENDKLFRRETGDVSSHARYAELIERADLVIVPTPELKIEVAMRRPDKPVVHLPEPVDYAPAPDMLSDPARKTVLWFGNPGRGNFESARWLLDRLRDEHGYRVRIVSSASFFKAYPDYQADVVPWSPEAMTTAFGEASLCVVTHAEGEQTKSANRLIAAVMHGLPTLVHSSSACEALLREAGEGVAIVETPEALAAALALFDDPVARAGHVARLQKALGDVHGDAAIAAAYHRLIEDFQFEAPAEPTRIGVVSHNLMAGEGAPRSLIELAIGLHARPDATVTAYSAGEGELEAAYRAAGLPIEIFDRFFSHCSKALNARFGDQRAHFQAWLERERIEVLLCNTVRAAPYAYFARELGIPSLVIVRESFVPDSRFSGLGPETRLAAEIGLVEAEQIVFVADESRAAWSDFRFEGEIAVIPNGVDCARFAGPLAMTRGEARAALGLPDDMFLALSVGTIGVRKAQGALVDAFAALPPGVREGVRLLFVGEADAGNRARFQERLDAARPIVGDAVALLPPTDEIGLFYRAADLLLMNSSNEAYPRSTMEALLFGLPILSTRVFGVLSQIDDGANGRLYAIGDMAGWARLFAELRGDEAQRARLGLAAARSFWRHTGKAEMVARYRALVGRLAKVQRRRSGVIGQQ